MKSAVVGWRAGSPLRLPEASGPLEKHLLLASATSTNNSKTIYSTVVNGSKISPIVLHMVDPIKDFASQKRPNASHHSINPFLERAMRSSCDALEFCALEPENQYALGENVKLLSM
eukprot:Gb_00644 [translate_table: standard]